MHKFYSTLKGFEIFNCEGYGSGFEKDFINKNYFRINKFFSYGDGDNDIYLSGLLGQTFSYGYGLNGNFGNGDRCNFTDNNVLILTEE